MITSAGVPADQMTERMITGISNPHVDVLGLLRVAAAGGCLFAMDTDAHAPGQLDWIGSGCARAEYFGIEPSRVINTRPADAMSARTAG